MKEILITGGAGFIGSHLIDQLISPNNKIICVDNLSNGKRLFIKKYLKNKNFKFYKVDINNRKKLDTIFKSNNIKTVYHLAANSDIKKGSEFTSEDLHNTFLTTFNLLDTMKNNNVKEIIFASSSAVYGELDKSLSENTGPLLPVSMYGAAKLSSEAYIASFCENFKMKAWIIRFPNVVGWRMTHGVIYDLLNKLDKSKKELSVLGDGNQNKPYVYVTDLVKAIILIYKKTSTKINLFNVSTSTSSRVKFIVEQILKEKKFKQTKVLYSKNRVGWIGDVPFFKYKIDKFSSLKTFKIMKSNDAIKLSIKKEILFRNANKT